MSERDLCESVRRGFVRGAWMVAAALAAAFGGACESARAQELTVKLALPDLVAESEWIVVADLADARARRNARGNLIVTDYRFTTAQALLGTPPGGEFVLTQGGGRLNGETQAISDAPEFVVGERYLLFVRPGRGEMFPPFVGGAQGVYRIAADGRTVSLGGDRAILQRDDLLGDVGRLVAARGAAPPRRPVPSAAATVPYPAKAFLPLALTPPGDAGQRTPQVAQEAARPEPGEVRVQAVRPVPESVEEAGPEPFYSYQHRISPPAVVNGFPHDWAWHPEEEYQMAKWNRYGGDVFHVYTTPTGNWAWGNDRFDLAGWPDDATMIAQFGEGWGANTLGITWSRWFGDGPIVEADTALNPAFCWTLDDRWATDGSAACWGFRQTMLHELGHSWGLKHPWETQSVWWDSVMNYSPHAYRLPYLFADDTNAVRAAFGGPAIHDALLSLYTTEVDGGSGAQSSVYTATQPTGVYLHHGDDLSASVTNLFKIENLGSDDIVSPRVDFYLSQFRMNWDAYVYLGTGYFGSVGVFTTFRNWLPSLPIPYSTPTGEYYLAAFLYDADANGENDGAWGNENAKIRVDNNPSTLYPQLYWQYSEFGALGPAGAWTFRLAAEEGVTYDLSLCASDGGSASFDTTLAIEYGGSQLAFDDDGCGYQSRLRWTAPYTATFTVEVASYHDLYQGTFQLAYSRETVDSIFANGFEPPL